jgi:hypothetical protein
MYSAFQQRSMWPVTGANFQQGATWHHCSCDMMQQPSECNYYTSETDMVIVNLKWVKTSIKKVRITIMLLQVRVEAQVRGSWQRTCYTQEISFGITKQLLYHFVSHISYIYFIALCYCCSPPFHSF